MNNEDRIHYAGREWTEDTIIGYWVHKDRRRLRRRILEALKPLDIPASVTKEIVPVLNKYLI